MVGQEEAVRNLSIHAAAKEGPSSFCLQLREAAKKSGSSTTAQVGEFAPHPQWAPLGAHTAERGHRSHRAGSSGGSSGAGRDAGGAHLIPYRFPAATNWSPMPARRKIKPRKATNIRRYPAHLAETAISET